jgi:phage recombination protein Bet
MNQTTAVAVKEPTAAALTFTQDEIDTIKNTVAKEATDSELKLFLMQCKRTGLDPFSRQIYFFKMGGKASIQSSIDGFRLIAERSGKYGGQTLPQFLDAEGKWHDVWTQTGYPVAAKVGVHRSDFKEPLYAIAKWSSYAPVYNGRVGAMWQKMPDLMLAKVAEALALRKAFPNDLSGLYTGEEMQQADQEPERVSYTVERVVPAEDDDETGHAERVIDVTPPKSDYPAMTPENNAHALDPAQEEEATAPAPADERQAKALKLEIANLLKKGWNFTVIGKPGYKTAEKVKELTTLDLVEENYQKIADSLANQITFNEQQK